MRKTHVIFCAVMLMVLMVITVSFASSSTPITYSGPPITLRYSSHVSKTHMVWQNTMVPWLKLLEEMSEGKLIIKTFTDRVLHGPKDGFKACVSNITDMTHCYPLWQPKSFNLNHCTSLPFAFPNAYVAAMVSEELYPKYFKEEYEKMGVYLAHYQTISPYHLISKKPIRTLEDMKGLKVRSGGGPIGEAVKRLGAVPVLLTTAEVYSAFQRGLIDAVLLYDSGFVSFRLHEIGKYRTELSLGTAGIPYCLNRKTFDNLPDGLKRTFYNAQRILAQMAGQGYENADVEAREIMKKKGIEFITLEPEELERWKALVEPTWEAFIKENEALGLPARDLIRDLRELTKKYSTWTPEQIMEHVTKNPVHGIIDGM
ncbi:MAG: TRAP transporter substrate-binding protein DctP [Deltaproteobacteria bacterium]|nr:TRAP transporter substrate-binding protein DctP [Deltaproteobacteria bacterium]